MCDRPLTARKLTENTADRLTKHYIFLCNSIAKVIRHDRSRKLRLQFGAENDNNTIIYFVNKPGSRHRILRPSNVTAERIGKETPVFARFSPFWGVIPKINTRSHGTFGVCLAHLEFCVERRKIWPVVIPNKGGSGQATCYSGLELPPRNEKFSFMLGKYFLLPFIFGDEHFLYLHFCSPNYLWIETFQYWGSANTWSFRNVFWYQWLCAIRVVGRGSVTCPSRVTSSAPAVQIT